MVPIKCRKLVKQKTFYGLNLLGSILSVTESGRQVRSRLCIDLAGCSYFLFVQQYSSLYNRMPPTQTCPFENHNCWNRKMCCFGMHTLTIRALYQCPTHSVLIRRDFCQFSQGFALPLSSQWPTEPYTPPQAIQAELVCGEAQESIFLDVSPGGPKG